MDAAVAEWAVAFLSISRYAVSDTDKLLGKD
jgi:hypothetical protein